MDNEEAKKPDEIIFKIWGSELEKLRAWMATRKPMYGGAIGGRYTYCFTNTSVGQIIKVQDGGTGEEVDISDYDGW